VVIPPLPVTGEGAIAGHLASDRITMPRAKPLADAMGDVEEFWRLADVERTMFRQRAFDHIGDAAGAGRHDHDFRTQIDCLGDGMGDETDRLVGAIPEVQKLFVKVVAHDFIERAKGFVHQEDVGVKGQGTGDAGALLHAARQLPGVFPLEPRKIDQFQHALDAGILILAPIAHDFERQADIAADGAPGVEPRRLKHIAIGARFARLFGAGAIHGQATTGGMLEVRHAAQKGGLATARGADEADEIALLHLKAHVLERMHRPVAGLKGQRQVARADDCVAAQTLSPAGPVATAPGWLMVVKRRARP